MDERQLTVCAIALFADGYTHAEIAQAFGVNEDRASELAIKGSNEQAAGTMGHMENNPKNRPDAGPGAA